MKKIVSSMALCAVLFGAVLMATGCGNKPAKGSVWKVETYDATSGGSTTKVLDRYAKLYYCFHADGYVYQLSQEKAANSKEVVAPDGGYLVKNKELTWGGRKATISDKAKDTLTFTYTESNVTYKLVMKASKDYKADEIKAKYTTR